MTKFETLIQAVRIGAVDLAQSWAALPVDKPSLASLVDPALHSAAAIPWSVTYLGCAVVAKYAHHRMWIIYAAIAIKLLAGSH